MIETLSNCPLQEFYNELIDNLLLNMKLQDMNQKRNPALPVKSFAATGRGRILRQLANSPLKAKVKTILFNCFY